MAIHNKNKHNKRKGKYGASVWDGGFAADELWEKEMDKERAWLFYESGVQDMREKKSLLWVYKF